MTAAPRHIMMTTDAVGGVWVYATALAKRLGQDGTRVTLVTLGPPPQTAKYYEVRNLEGVELIVTDLALEWLDPEGDNTDRACSELLRIAERVRPDLVHLNSFREGAFAWPCPAIVVAHSCVLSWWQAVRRDRPSERRWRAYAEAVAAGLNGANAWVAPTDAFRNAIDRLYQPATNGGVIPNGIDGPSHRTGNKQDVILASGRIWDGAKNLAALARVAAELPWPVHIAGAGMPENPDAADSVQWLGEISHAALQQRMRHAGIYAAPAFYEPFGLGILEAAAAGCALVLSDIDSLRELWEGAALFVSPTNSQQLRQALTAVCQNGNLRLGLQQAALTRAGRYSLDRTLSAYAELYRQVLAPSRSRKIRPSVTAEARL